MNSGITRARALALAREWRRREAGFALLHFDVKDEQLDELLCAVLRVSRIDWDSPWSPLRYLGIDEGREGDLRMKLASTRALFADAFRGGCYESGQTA